MGIEELRGRWPVLAKKWNRGEAIDWAEIERAFRENGDIPEAAKPFVQALAEDRFNGRKRVKIKRGKKSDYPDWYWERAVDYVESFRELIRQEGIEDPGECPELHEAISRIASQHGSALTLAIELVADRFGMDPEDLEQRRKRVFRARESGDKN